MKHPNLWSLYLSVRTAEAHYVGSFEECLHKAVEVFESDVLSLTVGDVIEEPETVGTEVVPGPGPETVETEVVPVPYPWKGEDIDKWDWIQREYLGGDADVAAIVDISQADNNLIYGPMNLGMVLSPFEIRETYERVFQNTLEKRKITNDIAMIKRQMDIRLAQAVADGVINGPNEDTRKAQRAQIVKDLQEEINQNLVQSDQIDVDLAADRVLIEMYASLINYFKTGLVEVGQ